MSRLRTRGPLVRRVLSIRPDGSPFRAPPATQGEATPGPPPADAHDWTPPPIPQPLPEPGGPPVELVGRQRERAEAPVSGAPTSVESPGAAGTPNVGGPAAGTAVVGGEIAVTNPQQPAQPMATPVTAAEAAQEEIVPAVTVAIAPDFRFEPPEVRIRAGEAVRWVNEGRAPQTVTGDPARVRDAALVALPEGAAAWDSGVLNAGDDFTQVFDTPGEYGYASMPQQQRGMAGRVIVEAGTEGTPTP